MSALRISTFVAIGFLGIASADAQTGCTQRDAAITDEVNKLVRDIESGARNITSVDAFLAGCRSRSARA